ncbi:MAG TPA: hypothetical protein VID27_04600 [Blastocatellia bacterium]|jgi:hypothetical protein
MTIDVQLTYKEGKIRARSEAAKYDETKPAILSLSIKAGEKSEKIEAVGELPETILSWARQERPAGSHTYRFVDPFAKDTFDPDCAFALVKYFCYAAHANIKPARSLLSLLWLDRFQVSIKLPHYLQIAQVKREYFEKLLRQTFRRIRVEP